MILIRMGNKRKIISKIAKHFPEHKMRIELFFGAGGSYFYLPKPKYSILNDADDDVTNLYLCIQNNIEELKKQIEILPVTESLINYWKENRETEPIRKAIRFLFLSNFTYMGKGDTLRLGLDNSKKSILKNLYKTFEYIKHSKITCCDFRDVIRKISFSDTVLKKDDAFVYLDPIYHETEHNYSVKNWTKQDTIDCLDLMFNSDLKCAMSEFDHPFVIEEAIKRNLNVIIIGERRNLKNRKVEILITNYKLNVKPQHLINF